MGITADEPEESTPKNQECELGTTPDSYYVFRAERLTDALPWFWQKVINHLWRRYKWVPLCSEPELTQHDRDLLAWNPATLDYQRVRELHALASRIAFQDYGYYNPHAQAIKCGRCNPHAKEEALALACQTGWGYHQVPTDQVLPTPAIQYGIHEYPMSPRPEDFTTKKPERPFYWDKS